MIVRSLLAGALALGLIVQAEEASADSRGRRSADTATPVLAVPPPAALLAEIERAIADKRYVDAGRMLDRAVLTWGAAPETLVLTGELRLARGEFARALEIFDTTQAAASVRARALQGRGIALSTLGRSEEALTALEEASRLDPSLWRTWNALGREYDRRQDWTRATEAYERAAALDGAGAAVWSNRGFSRLLQGRYPEATQDFVTALQKEPGLAAARTNLRLALGLQGQYDRAVASGGAENQAQILNNAGFAALSRGDLDEAERLLTRAIAVSETYYTRAFENLERVRAERASRANAAAATGSVGAVQRTTGQSAR